ncbi:HDOD domain-containing protein [Nitrosomonas sp.]|uniref:HDOD domain-containing protein n=1 Tax=Nitrosomonas sp. TaxID=42353 RepID=UPI001DF0BB03|nr:HDOD domain-containing protein [Nitrosomonas sp.]MBX3616842.1 HDOD domain-containing protein [Nitrosomonas sp.]
MRSIHTPFTAQNSAPNELNSSGTSTITIKNSLLEAIANDPDLPTLGSSISRIVQLSSSDHESIRQLSYFVLSDVSLTQKILRLSNSVAFRSSSNKVITSITKAIFLMGFNSVKNCALAMLLVDGMPGKQVEHVRTELIHTLAASMVSRELAKHSQFSDAEEIVVVTLFKNLGRLLLAAYEPDHYQRMLALITQGTHTPWQAAMQILGFNLETLTENILENWSIPASIIQALKNRPGGNLNLAKNKQEWMQQAAEFSEKAAPLALTCTQVDSSVTKEKLLNRFGKALNLDNTKLDQLIANATEETYALLMDTDLIALEKKRTNNPSSAPTEFNGENEEDVLKELVLETGENDNHQIIQRYPSGKPFNASILLLNGIQDVAEVMASGHYKLDDLIMLVLETYYNSLGFRFITLCLLDSKINQYRARSTLGKNNMAYQKAFNFPVASSIDLFHGALEKNVDLLISDAFAPKIRKLIPQWHKDLLPDARSFMILPLVTRQKPIGFFYADRDTDAPEGVSSEEIRLIRTLKGQALTAFNSR